MRIVRRNSDGLLKLVRRWGSRRMNRVRWRGCRREDEVAGMEEGGFGTELGKGCGNRVVQKRGLVKGLRSERGGFWPWVGDGVGRYFVQQEG